MKQISKKYMCIFIIATLLLLLFGACVYAASLNDVMDELEIEDMKRLQSKAKKDGTSIDIRDKVVFKMQSTSDYFDSNRKRIKLDSGESYRIAIAKNNNPYEFINGGICYTDSRVSFETSTPLEENGTYYVCLVDSSGNVVAAQDFTYEPEDIEEEEREDTSVVSALLSVFTNYKKLGKYLTESFVTLLSVIGDAVLDMLCNAMGEVVTIDAVVYNRVNKLNIDFFSTSVNTAPPMRTPLRAIMGDVINTFYRVLRDIAIVVFLIMLIYIGIKIMFISTAERKATYKNTFMAWVMGVAMLLLFPYVMKYTIKLNDTLCKMIGGEISGNVVNDVNSLRSNLYGKDEFVIDMLATGENLSQNAMMYVRYYGNHKNNVPLLIVYLIFIGQLLAMLFVYYKRVFMLAFLISIFPLVAIIYPFTKIGDVKMNPFGIWFKEFAVNVFVQSFHAATYKVIVSIGISAYLNAGHWLFMILCILFLFDGEKIIRAIFNANSKANTIGDMAVSGAMALGAIKRISGFIPSKNGKDSEDGEDKNEKAKNKAEKDRPGGPNTPTPGATSNMEGVRNAEASASGSGAVPATGGGVAGSNVPGGNGANIPLGRNEKIHDTSSPFEDVRNKIEERKENRKIGWKVAEAAGKGAAKLAGTAVSAATQATLGVTTFGFGAAQGDVGSALGATAAGVSAGKAIGKSAKEKIVGVVDKKLDKHYGRAVAASYLAGDYDEEIGITDDMEAKKKQALREVYAKLARMTGNNTNKEKAQYVYIKERLDIEKK